MDPKDFFIPKSPITHSLRPLTKGIMRDSHLSELPKEGLYDIIGYLVKRNGLLRAPGTSYYCGGNAVNANDLPLVDIVPFWNSSGSQVACLLTSRYLYTISGYAAASVQEDYYTTGTVACSGTAVTGTSTNWTTSGCLGSDDMLNSTVATTGDYISFQDENYDPEYEIKSVDSDTGITLKGSGTTISAGDAYRIRKRFWVALDGTIDSTVALTGSAPTYVQQIYMTDYERQPVKFNGSTVANTTFVNEDSTALDYVCGCITYFADRMWIGNLIEDRTNYYLQRIRWSNPGVAETFESTSYIDLPYTSGSVMRMLPLGSLLAVYFDDCVYLGRPTSDPDLPYAFFRLNTGGVGLVSPKAVVETLGGHVFLGKDDVYFLSTEGIKPMNCPSLLVADNPYKAYCTIDPERNRFVVGTTKSEGTINYIWSYNFKTNAWSRDKGYYSFIANPMLDLGLTWTDLTDTGVLSANNWNVGMAAFSSWDAITAPTYSRTLFAGDNSGYIHQFTDSSSYKSDVTFEQIVETGDLDFGEVDKDKTITEVRIRLVEPTTTMIPFVVEYSDNSGEDFSYLGSLNIAIDTREGKLNFKKTASTSQFRFLTQTAADQYTISEISFRVSLRGYESDLD